MIPSAQSLLAELRRRFRGQTVTVWASDKMLESWRKDLEDQAKQDDQQLTSPAFCTFHSCWSEDCIRMVYRNLPDPTIPPDFNSEIWIITRPGNELWKLSPDLSLDPLNVFAFSLQRKVAE